VLRALEETEKFLLQLPRATGTTRKAERTGAREQTGSRHREVTLPRGRDRFLVAVDAERTQLQAEDAVAESERDVYVAVIALYKALGGVPS